MFLRPIALLVVMVTLTVARVWLDHKAPWIQPVTDGLQIETDDQASVLAGEWTILITIDEPQPPQDIQPFIERFRRELDRSHSAFKPYIHHWRARLAEIGVSIRSPRCWFRTSKHNISPGSSPRDTRAIRFVGSVMKHWFGLATQSDVRGVQQAVQVLQSKQNRLVHLMHQFTTVINHTYDEIQTNRRQINLLTTAHNNLTARTAEELKGIHNTLLRHEQRADVETLLYELDRVALRYVRSHEAFLNRKANLEAGLLTENLLPPGILFQILRSVAEENAEVIFPIQWYYQNIIVTPIWTEEALVYRARLPMVDHVPWHHITVTAWPVPHRRYEATILLPSTVLRNTLTGDLDVSPTCQGHRPRVCRRGLITKPSVYPCLTRILGEKPTYDKDCQVSFKRRVPIDVVHPVAPNTYILITNGTTLSLRCEGEPQSRDTLNAGVFRVTLRHPCTLHGTAWNLRSTFHRTTSRILQTEEIPFNPPLSLQDLANKSDFDPFILDLKTLDAVDRKQVDLGDLNETIFPPGLPPTAVDTLVHMACRLGRTFDTHGCGRRLPIP